MAVALDRAITDSSNSTAAAVKADNTSEMDQVAPIAAATTVRRVAATAVATARKLSTAAACRACRARIARARAETMRPEAEAQTGGAIRTSRVCH